MDTDTHGLELKPKGRSIYLCPFFGNANARMPASVTSTLAGINDEWADLLLQRRSATPGRAVVICPSDSTAAPLTKTWLMPVGY